jgi:hypothetical protein
MICSARPAISADCQADRSDDRRPGADASLAHCQGPLTALETTVSATGPELTAKTEAEIAQIAAGYRVTVAA